MKILKNRTLLIILVVCVAMILVLLSPTIYTLIYGVPPFTSMALHGLPYCFGNNKFACVNPTYNTSSGMLTYMLLKYSSTNNSSLYNVQMVCTSNMTTSGFPIPSNRFEDMNVMNGNITPRTASNGNYFSTLVSNVYTVSNIQCYSQSGPYLIPKSPGSKVAIGYLWINYTLENGTINTENNPWITKEVAQITLYLD